RPVASGFGSTITSLNEGEESNQFNPLVLLLSVDSPAFASASFHSAPSVSRASFQLFVAFVVTTETDLMRSTLNQSLFNQSSGLASTLNGSETSATVFTSSPRIT